MRTITSLQRAGRYIMMVSETSGALLGWMHNCSRIATTASSLIRRHSTTARSRVRKCTEPKDSRQAPRCVFSKPSRNRGNQGPHASTRAVQAQVQARVRQSARDSRLTTHDMVGTRIGLGKACELMQLSPYEIEKSTVNPTDRSWPTVHRSSR